MSFFYNKKYNFVFHHLPKNAGSSIRGYYTGIDGLFPRDQWFGPILEPWQVLFEWPMNRSFAIVRDPVDRFMDAWAYAGPELDFIGLLGVLRSNGIDPSNLKDRHGNLLHHILPQCCEYNGLSGTTHLIRFTHLIPDLDHVLAQLGITDVKAENLPHINQTKEKPKELTDEIRDFIVNHWAFEDYVQLKGMV